MTRHSREERNRDWGREVSFVTPTKTLPIGPPVGQPRNYLFTCVDKLSRGVGPARQVARLGGGFRDGRKLAPRLGVVSGDVVDFRGRSEKDGRFSTGPGKGAEEEVPGPSQPTLRAPACGVEHSVLDCLPKQQMTDPEPTTRGVSAKSGTMRTCGVESSRGKQTSFVRAPTSRAPRLSVQSGRQSGRCHVPRDARRRRTRQRELRCCLARPTQEAVLRSEWKRHGTGTLDPRDEGPASYAVGKPWGEIRSQSVISKCKESRCAYSGAMAAHPGRSSMRAGSSDNASSQSAGRARCQDGMTFRCGRRRKKKKKFEQR